jgi:hypothetical protein
MSQPWQAPEAARLSVGGMASRDNIEHALKQIARRYGARPLAGLPWCNALSAYSSRPIARQVIAAHAKWRNAR